ncbi:hypothetical protein AMTR_s00014p00237110 [Amborella trichopoda]|uniref:Uncharacterized protein n=1 Tax=Amborella trichopoda TaxID=13333 RepID=W1PGR9_AMBTC|nr:hypothetical protein AMTR_s00014p00237110 [Amborella trichopoda]
MVSKVEIMALESSLTLAQPLPVENTAHEINCCYRGSDVGLSTARLMWAFEGFSTDAITPQRERESFLLRERASLLLLWHLRCGHLCCPVDVRKRASCLERERASQLLLWRVSCGRLCCPIDVRVRAS